MKLLFKLNFIIWGIDFEFKLQDFWIGLYWENRNHDIDIWLCIIPCFPIHYWSGYNRHDNFHENFPDPEKWNDIPF